MHFPIVSSIPQIFRGQGTVCRQGKAKLVKRNKCRLVIWVFCLLWKGWSSPPQWNIGWVQVSCWVPQLEELLYPKRAAESRQLMWWLEASPRWSKFVSVFWWWSMLMALPPVRDKHAQLTSLCPHNQREGSYWWNTPRALGIVWIKATTTTHGRFWNEHKRVFFQVGFFIQYVS